MFNMLRMDLRRLFKTRSFYIILGVTAGLILMVVLLTAVVSDPETLDDMSARGAEIDEIDRRMSEEIRNMTQLDLAYETLGSGFLLIITGIGVTLPDRCSLSAATLPAASSKTSAAPSPAGRITSCPRRWPPEFTAASSPSWVR